jgi:hypothetical protein
MTTTLKSTVAPEPRPTGPLAAALFAVPCAEFALLLADKIANRSKPFETLVYGFGKWIPGAIGSGPGGNIGPYSGKEIIALIVWLLSWVVLHSYLRNASPNITKSIKIFLIATILITINFIDPIADVTFAFVNWLPK